MRELPSISLSPAGSTFRDRGASPKTPSAPSSPGFGEVLRAIGAEAERGEALLSRAIRAGPSAGLSVSEMIALQAGVYRWVETVDLASKLVEKTAQAAKTITATS